MLKCFDLPRFYRQLDRFDACPIGQPTSLGMVFQEYPEAARMMLDGDTDRAIAPCIRYVDELLTIEEREFGQVKDQLAFMAGDGQSQSIAPHMRIFFESELL